MVRKLFAVIVAATLMAGTAWATDFIDVGPTPTAPADAALHTGSKGRIDGAAIVPITNETTAIAIGSSVGGNRALGTIRGGTSSGGVFIGVSAADTAFGVGPQSFTLTATSIATIDGLVTIGGATGSSVTAITLTGDLNVGGASNGDLTVTGLTKLELRGKVNIADLTAITGTVTEIRGNSVTAVNKTSGAITGGTVYGGGLNLKGGTYTDHGDVVLGKDSWVGAGSSEAIAHKVTATIDGKVYLSSDGTDLVIDSGSDLTVGNIDFNKTPGNTNGNIVTVNGAGSTAADRTTLTIKNKDAGAAVFTGDANANKAQGLTIAGGTIGADVIVEGELKLTGAGDGTTSGQAAFLSTATGVTNTLTAGSLTIGDATAPVASVVVNGANLTTTITSVTTINNTAKYTVAGVADNYQGGIVITGTGANTGILLADTTADVVIDTESAFVTLKNGGKIQNVTAASGTDKTFTIKGAGVEIMKDVTTATQAVVDASVVASTIVIEEELKVTADLQLKTSGTDPASAIAAGSYTQTAGVVTQDTAGMFTVNGVANISGAESEFGLIADNSANSTTNFKEGLTLADGATLKTVAGTTRGITLGDNKSLKLEGGILDASNVTTAFALAGASTKIEVLKNESEIITSTTGAATFDASNSTLIVNSAYDPTVESSLTLTGTGAGATTFADIQVKKGELLLDIDNVTTNKDMTIDSGAYLSNSKAVTITAAVAATKAFNAKAGSNIEATSGNYTLAGFTDAKLDGNMLIGTDAFGNVYNISTDSATATVGNNAVINLTVEAAQAAADAVAAAAPETFAVVAKTTPGALEVQSGAKIQSSALGQFSFDLGEAGTASANQFVLTDAKNVASGDDTEENRNQIHQNIQTAWADYGHGAEIDRTLSDAAFNAAILVPAAGRSALLDPTANNGWGDATFGQITLDMLQAIAGTAGARAGYSEGIGKGIFQNGNVSETLNAGVGEIRGVNSAIGARNVQLRGQMAGANGVSYEYANPSLLLNNDYANRIWAGYIGQWEKGDSRNGVSGYDYDSNGYIVGYDRLVGCNFAFGGAFAYSRGDYEDKAALSNSSKIDNYSFNGYATYSALNGVFASLFGGYTHQKNDINAVYARGALPNVAKSSDYDSDYWHLGGQFGYDFQPVDGLVLTPSIGLQYIHGRADSHFSNWFSTTNGGGFVNSTTQESLLLPIEIAARYTIDFSNCSRLAVEGNIGYSYNFMDDNGQAGMTLANIASGGAATPSESIAGYNRDAGRHTFNAGAGLRYAYNRFDIGLKYDYYLQQDAHAHRLMGTVGVSF